MGKQNNEWLDLLCLEGASAHRVCICLSAPYEVLFVLFFCGSMFKCAAILLLTLFVNILFILILL